MRFIPPVVTPAEHTLAAFLEVLSDKKKYEESFNKLSKLKKDATAACKENNNQLKTIEEWEKNHENRTAALAKKEADLAASQEEAERGLEKLEKAKTTFAREQDVSNAALEEKAAEVEKTRKASVTERNRIIRESKALDDEIARVEAERAQLDKDVAAYEAMVKKVKLAMAS